MLGGGGGREGNLKAWMSCDKHRDQTVGRLAGFPIDHFVDFWRRFGDW